MFHYILFEGCNNAINIEKYTIEPLNYLRHCLIEKKYAHMVTMDQLNQLAENMDMFTADEVQKVVSLAAGYAIDAMDESNTKPR